MILVSNGVGLSLMHFGDNWKFIHKDEGEESSPYKKNFYALKNKKISPEEVVKGVDIMLWGYHIGKFNSDEFLWKGHKVVNGMQMSQYLEQDREASITLLESEGIPVPLTYFSKPGDSIHTIETCEFDKMVIKPSGDFYSWTTQICGCKDEAVDFIESNSDILKKSTNIAIQEFIEGEEISCEVWIGKDGVWRNSLNHTIETKKFLSGGLGLSTGSEYSLVWFPTRLNACAKYTLKIAKWFHEHKFIGCIDVNYIIDKKGDCYALEITPRCGYNAHYATFSMINNYMGITDFFNNLYKCNFDIEPAEKNTYGFSLGITVPPYPLEIDETDKLFEKYFKNQVVKIDANNSDVDFIPEGIDPVSYELLSPYVGQVVCIARKWSDAVRDTYDFAKHSVRCLNKQYRDDGIKCISEKLARLGYLLSK